MKRLPKTLTAAALTGALALGGTAVAQAQIPAPAQLKVGDKEYERQADGSYLEEGKDSGARLSKEDAEAAWEKQQADDKQEENADTSNTPAPGDTEDTDTIERHDTAADPITVDGVEYYQQLDGSWLSKPEFGNPARLTKEQAEKFVAEQHGDANNAIPAPVTKEDNDGNTWYQHIQDPTIYVKDSNDVNMPITQEMRDAYAKAFPGATDKDEKDKFDAKKLAWLALPAALIIGGITWHLNHNGKTYVKDEDRKDKEPTAEEKAASEKMLQENKDEVIAQGGKVAEGNSAQGANNGAQSTDGVRGMAAETGSNTIARGAVALAIAGLLAAGAFVARRKFFA